MEYLRDTVHKRYPNRLGEAELEEHETLFYLDDLLSDTVCNFRVVREKEYSL